MDALKPCSAIVDLPSNEWVMNKQEQAALLAYVSVKRHSIDRDPKLSKKKEEVDTVLLLEGGDT